MKIAQIAYLSELFEMLRQGVQALASGVQDAAELERHCRLLVRVLRQISAVSAELADEVEGDAADLVIISGRLRRKA